MDNQIKTTSQDQDDVFHHVELNLDEYPIKNVLNILLQDKTTGKNIIWATSSYQDRGEIYADRYEITKEAILGKNKILIQPRAFKDLEDQQERTKSRAEVFTPSWVVNKMINQIDNEWFGKENVFNYEIDQSWRSNSEQKIFKTKKEADHYIQRRVLEITCGEAPFLTSRYDALTGQIIPIEDRIGLLDRKMKAVQEKWTAKDWMAKARKAYKSTYGYEFQGDNLLIARINLLLTFVENYEYQFGKKPDQKILEDIADIIAWNVFQMDGLTYCVPLGEPKQTQEQVSFFNLLKPKEESPLCLFKSWSKPKESITVKQIGEEREDEEVAKFDFVIGNPPYQIEAPGTSTSDKPVYNLFIDESQKIADKVELITPGRFLFNAGATPKSWNLKMLNNPHLSVLYFNQKSSDVFPNTDIKGGVAISYIDQEKKHRPIEVYTPYKELNSLRRKVAESANFKTLVEKIAIQNRFNLDSFLTDYPELKSRIGSNGKDRRFEKNIFIKIPVFTEEPVHADDIKVLGIIKNKRAYRYIPKKYVDFNHENLKAFKVLVPVSNGSGALGEVLSTPLIGSPLIGYTRSFIGIGSFNTEDEANNALKYIKSKFARTMLGILKITQDNPPEKWKYVPLQDFTDLSDIDWSKTISEIDQQLYKKYDLAPEEIEFIETHVKEME